MIIKNECLLRTAITSHRLKIPNLVHGQWIQLRLSVFCDWKVIFICNAQWHQWSNTRKTRTYQRCLTYFSALRQKINFSHRVLHHRRLHVCHFLSRKRKYQSRNQRWNCILRLLRPSWKGKPNWTTLKINIRHPKCLQWKTRTDSTWCTRDFMWNKQCNWALSYSKFKFQTRDMTNKDKQHMVHSLIYVGRRKAKRTIIYSKIYLRVECQLIFSFHRCANKYSISLLT